MIPYREFPSGKIVAFFIFVDSSLQFQNRPPPLINYVAYCIPYWSIDVTIQSFANYKFLAKDIWRGSNFVLTAG